MKKTQKELAAQQLKTKRKKHKEKKDHIINEISEINLEEGHEKKIRKHKSKKKHSSSTNQKNTDDPLDTIIQNLKHSDHETTGDDFVSDQEIPTFPMARSEHPAHREGETVSEDRTSPKPETEGTQHRPSPYNEHLSPKPENEKSQHRLSPYNEYLSDPKQSDAIVNYHNDHNDDSVNDDSVVPRYEPPAEPSNVWKEPESAPPSSTAIVERRAPRPKKVNGLPWSDYNGQSGRYTGEVNDEYMPHGRGEMVYDRGVVSSGIWYKGVLDTEGPLTQDEYVPDRLPSYSVGDKGREEDMVIDGKKETAAAVALLRVSDGAFVRRSDGNWTYAVVKQRIEGSNASIKFKVNSRGSTKSFPMSQWGSYIRRIKPQASEPPAKKGLSLDQFLSNNRSNIGSSNSVAGGNFGVGSSDHSVGSIRSLPVIDRSRSVDNLTTGKMKIRSRSRSRSRNRKNVTTLPLLFSSSMSVSEENEIGDNDGWETASGSGYRLRGIDP